MSKKLMSLVLLAVMKRKQILKRKIWWPAVAILCISLMVSGKPKGLQNEEELQGLEKEANFPDDFGKLRKDTQAEWAGHRAEIQAEIAAERAEILRLYKDEQEAIASIWGTKLKPSSLEQYQLDPAYKSEVNYSKGYLKVDFDSGRGQPGGNRRSPEKRITAFLE